MQISERQSCYMLTALIVGYFDRGKRPSLGELRENHIAWSFKDMSDELIEDKIERVSKYYK